MANAPNNTEQARAIRSEIRSRLAKLRPNTVREPEQGKVERFRDGTAKDELVRLEEQIDMERAGMERDASGAWRHRDRDYYEENRDAVLRILALRAQKADAERIASEQQAAWDRMHQWQAKRAEQEAAAAAQSAAEEQARQDAIDEQWSRPPGA